MTYVQKLCCHFKHLLLFVNSIVDVIEQQVLVQVITLHQPSAHSEQS